MQVGPGGWRLVLAGALQGAVDRVTLTGYDAAGHPVLDIREQPAAGVDVAALPAALPAAMHTGASVRISGQTAHRFAGAHLWWV